ncbi:MAG: hypothetical protein JSR79_07415 [Proteobacteria bacterium]|nr:hypothetical protein [Pseudomonadota bacterium]
MMRWVAIIGGGGAAIALVAGGMVVHDYRRLQSLLQPATLNEAVACWQDADARNRIMSSESRRDTEVIRIALSGENLTSQKHAGAGSGASAMDQMIGGDRSAERLNYTYEYFWSPGERRRIFDYAMSRRPICGPNGTIAVRSRPARAMTAV